VAARPDRNNRAIFVERLGMVYREQENYQAAVDTFRKMLTLGENNPAPAIRTSSTPTGASSGPKRPQRKEAVQKMPNDRGLRNGADASCRHRPPPKRPSPMSAR